MKYLKPFNEELNPSTYRNAASKLDYYNKSSRSRALFDYADEKQYGFYKLHLANGSVMVDKNATFTQPKLIGVYYGSADNMSQNVLSYGVDADKVVNQAVKNWISGNDMLGVVFEFGFRPTKETLSKKDFGQYKNPQRPNAGSGYLSGYVPFFSLELELSEWHDGLEEWDSEAKWDAEQSGDEFIPSTVDKFYDWTKSRYLRTAVPNFGYFGIFADRSSALKFKNWLQTIVNEDIKERMMDLLTIVSNDADDVDKIIQKFNNIRIHGLYDDEADKGSANQLKNKWYDKSL
jgi:hypothetical protein